MNQFLMGEKGKKFQAGDQHMKRHSGLKRQSLSEEDSAVWTEMTTEGGTMQHALF